MKKYYANPDEFIGFAELMDVVNHNTEVFERHIAAEKRRRSRRLGGGIMLFVGAMILYTLHDYGIYKLEQRVKELEEKGD